MLSRDQQFISALLRRSLKGGPSLSLLDGPYLAKTVCHISSQHPLSLWPCCWGIGRVLGSSIPPPSPAPCALTTLRHHALLCLGCLGLAHGAVRRAHLDHAVPLLHAHPAGGAALIPLTPLGHQAAAGSWKASPVGIKSTALAPPPPALAGHPYSQHSSLTVHFSVSSVGSVHTEPSSGNCFTYLSRERMPTPQEMLQGDQVIHSDMVQAEPSATHERTLWPVRPAPRAGIAKERAGFPIAYSCLSSKIHSPYNLSGFSALFH